MPSPIRFCIVVLSIVAFTNIPTHAQNASLQGKWVATLTIPVLGSVPVDLIFKSNSRGTFESLDSLPLVYRELNSNFSATVEVPAESSPNGQAVTIVIRGTKTDDNNFTGTLLLVLDAKDGTGNFVIAPGQISGQRR
jgi:hypothetical protein